MKNKNSRTTTPLNFKINCILLLEKLHNEGKMVEMKLGEIWEYLKANVWEKITYSSTRGLLKSNKNWKYKEYGNKTNKTRMVQELEKRVQELEKRVQELEKRWM